MVAYLRLKDAPVRGDAVPDTQPREPVARRRTVEPRHKLARDMLHGLSPEEFDVEARSLASAEALTPQVRERMRTQLVERLKTPIDAPSWGPDWIGRRDEQARTPTPKSGGSFRLASLLPALKRRDDDEEGKVAVDALDTAEREDARMIARNMERSRQVFHFRSLYVLAALAAIGIALLAMFVDFQIIKGDIWTRALANEFMVVPASLQGTLLFKSMQVVFAVLIIHFMLKITGRAGRNTMITTAFILALVMIGCLGYLVAYNNMTGGTSTALEHQQDSTGQSNAIDRLFASSDRPAADPAPRMTTADLATTKSDAPALALPKPSEQFLASADSWFWLAFASVIFFIVTTVAALYMQVFENNIRNVLISRDYIHRRKQFAQLHLLELAEAGRGA
jgi:hypothetical protein